METKEDRIQFITVEKIKNGFIISCPEASDKKDYKVSKGTINGVTKFMEKIWDVSKIEDKNRVITDVVLKKARKNDKPVIISKKEK